MNVGPYKFSEFKELAVKFHGYAAPGLLIGGYMTVAAKAALPDGVLFEALVETYNCLPDAVQLLTPCSTGNKRLHVVHYGKTALSLFDKYSGRGVRARVDPGLLGPRPEIRAWIMKEKGKEEQDEALLEQQIAEAGTTIIALQPVTVDLSRLNRKSDGPLAFCPRCGESFPAAHGGLCRGCAEGAPYSVPS
ncbi:MAG: formylmethanofuran dehydrogenase subunit E family protein [Desulfovibrio sp.]|jgi:formylmethanofuran dehydrogenase subunit E|nr:formylmethanofuran dehydrogenase subunit E family protein [Desulfovibrio sp.]